jgi:alanine-glyoxylate transaminase / serine-glyoxylate transaminase / serine-pyruvate transaminase
MTAHSAFDPSARILLGPGPSMAHPRVMRALSAPTVGHLDPELLALYAEEQGLLRTVFQTKNEWTFALSGTGTSGMEAALVNLVEPGDEVLVAIHGYFGERLAEIAARVGGQVDQINRPPGGDFHFGRDRGCAQAKAIQAPGNCPRRNLDRRGAVAY